MVIKNQASQLAHCIVLTRGGAHTQHRQWRMCMFMAAPVLIVLGMTSESTYVFSCRLDYAFPLSESGTIV